MSHSRLPWILGAAMLALPWSAALAIEYPGQPVGKTAVQSQGMAATLGNQAISFGYSVDNQRVGGLRWNYDAQGKLVPAFAIELEGGKLLSTQMQNSEIKVVHRPGDPKKSRLGDRLPAEVLEETLTDVDGGGNLQVVFRAICGEGANYIRHEIEVSALKAPVKVKSLIFFDGLPLENAKVSGYTDGSVVVTDKLFLGIEHPMAKMSVESGSAAELGKWQPEDFKKGTMTLPLAGQKPGAPLEVEFLYERGNHRLDIEAVELLADGQAVATDRHSGFTGLAKQDNLYKLAIPAGTAATAKLELRATFKQTNETTSWGKILCREAGGPVKVFGRLPRNFELKPGAPWKFSAVIGTYPEGQQRRAFLFYLDRERAHPYRLFYHYNSWYHLGIDWNDRADPMQRMTEQNTMKAVTDIGQELYEKRGVQISSYVWDDGWDDWNSLWSYHRGFPNGFTPLATAAKAQKSGIGAWLSPWGGYGGSHNARVGYGKKIGLETNGGGFSMAAPKYYAAFRDRCLQMIHDYDMNYFKFDGIGSGAMATGAPDSIAPDLDGLVRLIGELRQAKPDVYVNCTVGTWASPFWTMYADSVWRQGADCSYHGDGNAREQWITYKDMIAYGRFAKNAPLYPLNSIMLHGIIVGDRSVPARMPRNASPESTASFTREMWMLTGGGTDLQELYLSPELMRPEWWDIVAEAIRWGRAHEEILADTHWIGGDPERNQAYGYASWQPRGGILVLRNPSKAPQKIEGTLQQWLELPGSAAKAYTLKPAHAETAILERNCDREEKLSFELAPFEVRVLEALPRE